MFIKILKEYCHECYACVRNCPVSAVKVNDGKVEVIDERCINCGKCVNLCSQNAREIVSYKDKVLKLLKEEKNIAAALAPSYFVYKNEWQKEDWFYLLDGMGFKNIYEVAWGAELICEKYTEILQNTDKSLISSACPVIVNLIKKYYPQLSDNIIEVVSPMKALSRYLKKENPAENIVLIGPCQAKKVELKAEENVAAVLTFSELFSIAEQLDIKPAQNNIQPELESSSAKKEISNSARSLAVGGELFKKVSDCQDNSLHIEGEKEVIELIEALEEGKIELKFADLLFCKGCIDGVDLKDKNYFVKEKQFFNYLNSNSYFNQYSKDIAVQVDLSCQYQTEDISLPEPSEKELWEILNKTDKYLEEDLLDCGACGYDSCRNKAAAVAQGLAEVNICLPYLLKEKRGELKEIQKVNKNLDLIISSSYDGIMLLDKNGVIEKINTSYLEMLDLELLEVKGRKITDLEKELELYPVFELDFLKDKDKDKITFVQNHGKNQRIILTAKSIKNPSGELEQIIINARDLAEINFSDSKNELTNQDIPDYIISKSKEMKKVLNLAARVAETDSTILITGESGTGKEVIARFIYEKSKNRGEFVKINCAAIPKNLLESELFGYEEGSFSGAKRQGKKGLIEKADRGTLFLDEIAELPFSMQAKLLQVIQDHKLSRVGGLEEIEVDFRLITATNKDLKKMAENKEFREDLFYRLNVVPINIAPLRERREDITALINYYKKQYMEKYQKNIEFNSEAREFLYNYNYPGNVRELSNILERIIITAESNIISKKDLKELLDIEIEEKKEIKVEQVMPLKEAVAQVEKDILAMLKEDLTTYEIADLLKVNQSTVVRKIKKYFN